MMRISQFDRADSAAQGPPFMIHRGKFAREVSKMTDRERKDIQKAQLYDLRLLIKNSEKDTYTKEELMDLFDTIALAKDQEQ